MKYRTFGKTGEKVSVLGYGTMRLPIIGDDYGKVDEAEAMKLVHRAVDGGVNYIDTSWPYHGLDQNKGGASEPFVGKALKEIGRDKVFVATKLPIWAVEKTEDMDMFLDRQLERLGTDYVDFYLVHNIMKCTWGNVVNLGLHDFLDRILKSGKVRYVGFSFHDTPELFREVLDFYDFSFCQHICNYHDINFQAGMAGIRAAANRGMGFVAMEPLMGGMLANQLPREAMDILDATGVRRSAAAWALRWVWDQPEVSLLLSGMNSMEQVEENLRLADESDEPLSAEELGALDNVRALLKSKGGIPCTECGKCSCPKGVFIPACFSLYNGNHAFDVIHISMMNYGMALKGMGNEAALCDGCGACAGQCPQGLDIPAQLRKVARYFEHVQGGW